MTYKQWSKKAKEVMNERDISVLQIAFTLNRSMEYIYRQLNGRKLAQKGVDEISNYLGIESFEVKK